MTAIAPNAQPSFEETYPKAPFPDLVRLALALAETLVKLRARPKDSSSAGMGHGHYA